MDVIYAYLMHTPQNLGGTHAFGNALIACVHQPQKIALVSRLRRHDGGLRTTVYESCHFAAIDLQQHKLLGLGICIDTAMGLWHGWRLGNWQ